jgi:D-tyrosyl-tRNA(Tyr) deacylase
LAAPLVERFADQLRMAGVDVARGRFGEHMLVELINDGPVTLVIDSADLERPRRQA